MGGDVFGSGWALADAVWAKVTAPQKPQTTEMSDANFAAAADAIDARLRSRISVKAGPHEVGVAFIGKNSAEYDEPLE